MENGKIKKENKLKIIFVGTPDMALICLSNLLQKKFNIVGVVPPPKDHDTFEFFKDFVEFRGLNFLPFEKSPNEKEYIERLKELEADIGVVCSYNMLLKQEFIKTTKMGYINCHPSLLPNYRGAMPYFHIINNGEAESGITLHFIDETFDTGDIIYQHKFKITPFETMGTLFNRTNFMISDALAETLTKIEKENKIESYPQIKDREFIKAPKVEGNFKLEFKKLDIFQMERLIRATNPFFRTYCTFRNTNIKIIQACPIKKNHNFPFGKIVSSNEKELLVAAKGGYLSIEILQVGSWGIFTPKEFYKNFSANKDEFFS